MIMSVKSYYQQVPLMFVTPSLPYSKPQPLAKYVMQIQTQQTMFVQDSFSGFFPSQYKNAIIKLAFPCASSSFLLLFCNDGESREMKVRLG